MAVVADLDLAGPFGLTPALVATESFDLVSVVVEPVIN